MVEQLPSEKDAARSEIPTTLLRWKRTYNGLEMSAPVLQQLWQVEVFFHGTMVTKRYDEWRDVSEVGPND
jgi:hypothetical protein